MEEYNHFFDILKTEGCEHKSGKLTLPGPEK
jgi:hypothetical protein